MSAAKFVSITTNDKYFISAACKPYIGWHSFLTSDLPNLAANTAAVLECFQNDGPKGDRYVFCSMVFNAIFNNISVMSW